MSDHFIPISKPFIGAREKELVLDALDSGWVSSIGKYIDEFETNFAHYCGTRYALAVSNGTTGLHLALAAVGLKQGDEVIVPDLTFVATANAVAYTGAKPVLADVDADTLCLDPASVKSLVTPRTKAIIPVHLYGHPAEMDALIQIADAHGVAVIEDAAEAHGAEYRGRRVGGLGKCAVFSFYGNKVITTGEGGMLTTNDQELYQRAKRLRDHAMSPQRRYFHEELGFNYRITNLQAALGVAQLERIDDFLDRRSEIMNWYNSEIATTDRIRLNRVKNWAKSAFWMVCLEVDWFNRASRDAFMSALKARGIDSRPYFCTMSSLPMYRQTPLPTAARKAQIGLNLPSYYELTKVDVQRIGAGVSEILKEMRPRERSNHFRGAGDVVIKLGVLALAGPDNGGTYQYTLSMLHGLQHTKGFEITLYGDPQNPDLAELGYPISPFREPYARQLAALAADRLHISLPDPFVSQDIMLSPIYSLALLHTSKPFAYTLHDLQQNYYPENFSWWQRAWRHQIYTRMLARVRRIICESEYVKADIIRYFGVAGERIVVMPAPPQRQFLKVQSDEQLRAARGRLQLPEQFLFYPAHFWVHKNHLCLIEAFREVVREIPDLKLVLTGKKQEAYQSVMVAIDKFGLQHQVRHLGYVEQEDLQAIYRLATALVMPSLFESISIPIYEAFQVGTPVAASNILAIPEQVGDAGLLFDPKSVASIKQAILEIVRNPERARLLASRGRDRMSAMTPERYGAQLQDLLRGLQ